MERRRDRADVAQDVSFWMSDMAFSRFRSFCDQVLGIRIDKIPSEQSILMKQNFLRGVLCVDLIFADQRIFIWSRTSC